MAAPRSALITPSVARYRHPQVQENGRGLIRGLRLHAPLAARRNSTALPLAGGGTAKTDVRLQAITVLPEERAPAARRPSGRAFAGSARPALQEIRGLHQWRVRRRQRSATHPARRSPSSSADPGPVAAGAGPGPPGRGLRRCAPPNGCRRPAPGEPGHDLLQPAHRRRESCDVLQRIQMSEDTEPKNDGLAGRTPP